MYTTSIKLKFRSSTVDGNEGRIYFQFIRKQEVKTLSTSYKLFPSEWNPLLEKVRLGCSSPMRESYLQQLSSDLIREYKILESNIRRQENQSDFNLKRFIDLYRRNKSYCMLSVFSMELVQSLLQSNRVRTARAYRDAARNFIRFNGGQDFPLEQLDVAIVKEYETYMKLKGNKLNTMSFYMRNLRMIHKNAINRRLIRIPGEDLFAGVFTGVSKTKKRAVKKEVLEELLSIDFSVSTSIEYAKGKKNDASLQFARDLFMLSFYMRGISFIDLAYLRKKDIKNGIITYQRHKTGQILEVAITPEMKEIIDRHAGSCNNSIYLLPVLKKDDSRKTYENALKKQNNHLKTLSKMIGEELGQGLTTYVTRHSWATIARRQGIPLSLISQGLGHESERTTMIYLDSFDYTPLHAANQAIIDQTTKKAS